MIDDIRQWVRSRRNLFKFTKLVRGEGEKLLLLDYPVEMKPRYGYGKKTYEPIKNLFESGRKRYEQRLKWFLRYGRNLVSIPFHEQAPDEPYWLNGWLSGLDLVTLYGMVTSTKPKTYIEIGSGISTRVVRKAITDHRLPTQIISIDPAPRVTADSLCDKIIRKPLEEVKLSVFESLSAGDILFVDGSHRSLPNSDVTVIFLDILPRLKPGVVVHFHDIYWPNDYPAYVEDLFYSEQYLLATYLLAAKDRTDVLLPNAFIAGDPELKKILQPLWKRSELAGVDRFGASFWLQIK